MSESRVHLGEREAKKTIAWGDESVLLSAKPPSYLLAATIFVGNEQDAIQALMALKPKGARKLHWRSMTDNQKLTSMRTIAAIEHQTIVVIGAPIKGIKQERARRKCLEILLIELQKRDINELTLESRQERLDKLDRDCLMFARRANSIGNINLTHLRGEDDPHLWLPDQVLGAYGEHMRPTDNDIMQRVLWNEIARQISIVKLSL